MMKKPGKTTGGNGNGNGRDGGYQKVEDGELRSTSVLEYEEGTAFPGVVGIDARESVAAWPAPLRAKAGAPNVIYIVLDDVGFGQLGCYGGPIETPNLDRLANQGLRYTNFHTTALCSPTRSCLLTGRNHHANSMAGITEGATGYPGYNGRIPKENGFLSEMLLLEGYATFAVGKWHLTPVEECNPGARKDRWPLGRGFERFYGFLGGETDQWTPSLVEDNRRIDPPRTPEDGYHLTEDLVDQAIGLVTDLKAVAPDKPFMLYFCPGAAHAPHHVAKEWSDKYRGRFDKGWEAVRQETFERQKHLGIIPPDTELTPRPEYIQAWDSLREEERRLYARMMEVFAGFVSHADHHVGRLLDFLERTGQLENTILFVVSDNGASAEGGTTGSVNENRFFNNVPESLEDNLRLIDELGGPNTYNHYPFGWTWAGNTPAKKWKREVNEGGVADPLIVHWPAGIKARGELRRQYTHAIDLVPTVLECLNVEPPRTIHGVAQSPIEGTSFAYSFEHADAPERHETQYYEMLGNRAIYHKGWKAVTYHGTEGIIYDGKTDPTRPFSADVWELYHVERDVSEARNLADQHPEKLRELVDLWWVEAGRHNVLPLDARGQMRLADPRPQLTPDRKRYVYLPGGGSIPEAVAVDLKNRSHTIVASVEIPADGPVEGVLLAHGGRFGGYSLFVKDRRLVYVHNYCGIERFSVRSDVEVPSGRCSLMFTFEKTSEPELHKGKGAAGIGRLYINGRKVGESHIPVTQPLVYSLTGEGLCCGYDRGLPVTDEYRAPFRFTGVIERVVVDVTGARTVSKETESRIAMTVQ